MQKRIPNWESALRAHFHTLQATPFKWGTFDCALAVCDGADAITGLAIAASFRGKYRNQTEALAIIGNDLGAFAAKIAAQYDFPEWLYKTSAAPKMSRRGDAVLVDNSLLGGSLSTALGTVDLTGRYAWCAAQKGFLRVPMHRWLRAWRIG